MFRVRDSDFDGFAVCKAFQVEVTEGPEFVFRRALGSVPDCKEPPPFAVFFVATICLRSPKMNDNNPYRALRRKGGNEGK